MTTLLPSRADSLSEQIARTARRTRAPTRVVGVEHEFGVFDGDVQVDFRELIHDLSISGMSLHPTNQFMYLTERGSAIIADGKVAEIATPPISLEIGTATTVSDWAEEARKGLQELLPAHLAIRGGSTHISITTEPATNDRLALLFSRTFATALMLLMDQRDSPGMLVRPRPGRIELCGEFIVGSSLTTTTVFAIGAVLAVEEHIKGHRDVLPPFLDVALERGRRRHGWYVDRSATGTDLYDEGRAAVLHLANGATHTAQQYLEQAWVLARPFAARFATHDELVAVDRVVAGATQLPMEAGSYGKVFAVRPRSAHIMGIASTSLESREFTLSPSAATWDWIAWEATDGLDSAIVSVPRAHLATFRDDFEAGQLDRFFEEALATSELLPALKTASQAATIGFFGSIVPSPALLPVDRYGIGNAPSSSVRPGKRDLPPPTNGFFSSLGAVGMVAIGLIAVGLIGLALALGGFFDTNTLAPSTTAVIAETVPPGTDNCSGSECEPFATDATCVGAECDEVAACEPECSETTAPAALNCVGDVCQDPRSVVVGVDPVVFADGGLWLVGTFAEPWTEPPDDLLSFFFEFGLTVDAEGSTVGWQIHDGQTTPFSGNRLIVFDDGAVWAETGISPGSDWTGTVSVRSGSWLVGDEQAMFGDWSLELGSDSMLDPALLNDLQSTYNLLTGEPVEEAVIWMGPATFFANEFPVNLTGLTTMTDPSGDLEDYYGTLDTTLPDVTSVEFANIEFDQSISDSDRMNLLTSLCDEGIGAGTTSVCPDSLELLATSSNWDWFDTSFSDSGSFNQLGVACTVEGVPTYEGPPSDPNTGRNLSFEVFRSAGYQVGSTTFNGSFDSGPSDSVLAIVRNNGATLIVPSEALSNCSDPTMFMINDGGVDFLALPESPGGTYSVGADPFTTEVPTTEVQPVTTATPSTEVSEPAVPSDVATSSGTSTPIWPFAVSLIALLGGAGLYFSSQLNTSGSAHPVFEKGSE